LTSVIAQTDQLDFGKVTAKGRELWAALQGDRDFETIVAECSRYSADWKAAKGSMTLPGVDLRTDGRAYVTEGLKLMVLFTAAGGMIPAPSSVDAAMHAATAQLDLCRSLAQRIGLAPEHRTLEEVTMPAYAIGGFTDRLYKAVFGEEPPRLFWIDQATIDERFNLIAAHLSKVGIDLRAGAVDEDAFQRLALANA
jgi:hypothetical protein